MIKHLRWLLGAWMLLVGVGWSTCGWAAAPAVPSIQQVYAAASSGRLQQARREIDQVLAAYPDSAKAHYVSARVAALQADWPRAAAELARAQRLDPGLGFAHRDTLRAFTRQVASHTGQPAPARRRGLPLGGIGIALAVLALLVLWAVYRASRRPPVQAMAAPAWPLGPQPPGYPGGVGGAQPPGYPGGVGQPGAAPYYGPYPPAQGGGMLGAVGTGLAVGAGVAAGEMLVDKLFQNGNAPIAGAGGAGFDQAGLPDAGSLPDDGNFGIDDASSWSDDSSGSDGWN